MFTQQAPIAPVTNPTTGEPCLGLTLVCPNWHNDPMSKQARKPLKWVGSAKRDFDASPEDVKDLFGHAIDLAQAGGKHPDAKVLTGFGSAGVLEVVEDDRSSTYRAVYTVKFAGWIYVFGSTSCTASRRSPSAASRRRRKTWI